uniref:Peptidyl-prolyl cis-trans isomerase n=1 Tax=Alexandrium catenella TaxID=2925 RepID=A0A7S1LI91_ALECA
MRHIVLKHRECKSTVDKVRNRQVKRSRGEAERQLRAVLEECEGDPKRRAFTLRCKELSECTSCLSAGDLAGDLGWVKPGKFGQAFDAAAFPLQVGQLSDLVDSELGIHIIMRVA